MTVRDTVTTSTTSPAVGSASIRSHSVASALWVVADASLRTTTTPMMLDFRLKFDAGGYATNGNNEIMS
ncbi:hypothetical protein Q4528_15125, partial [Staphylococcus pasteuri_A]|nr:hypothetical protein [Staphylococcus pasteuri_A]